MRLLYLLLSLITVLSFSSKIKAQNQKPNIIIILADDLGYGDLSCYGHPTIRTPYLDQMAKEGMRFTQFYVAANVCSPSRAALLTGRLPLRIGMAGEQRVVLFPNSSGGLPASEITIAEALKSAGYSTGIIGKWHLGHLPQYLPAKQGFDYFYGIPYSNDMNSIRNKSNPPLPLYKDSKVIGENPDQSLSTKNYTEEAINFIKRNKTKPFFLYYANHFPHEPLSVSNDFKGKSKRGLYGDVVAELDWSVGQVLKTLREQKLDKNTLVIFTSDNGPTLQHREAGGSAGLLYEGKKTTYEGGMRVPAIAWWPGKILTNQISETVVTSMDIMPTVINLADINFAKDRRLDGADILPVLTGEPGKADKIVYYYNKTTLQAIRKGSWKVHFYILPSSAPAKEFGKLLDQPLLYNLDADPSERLDVSKAHPEIIEDIRKEYDRHVKSFTPMPLQFDAIIENK
jgi:arylsulfatase A-like enzyme